MYECTRRAALRATTSAGLRLAILALSPAALILAGSDASAFADDSQPPPDDAQEDRLTIDEIRALELEALLGIQLVPVVTVAGVEVPWLQTPSAIHVITAEDIRRSGHRHLAEVLRLVPGMHVGQINSSQWAVSSRGFASRFANKLLVLIDGRSVYDPLFSGTFWETQDVVLEDVERIEVIRGPGATLWGANAVNGVVNVITKSAKDTQGLLINAGGGTFERAFGTVRYGGQISHDAWFRVWTKYTERAALRDVQTRSAHDDWNMLRGGFRIDADTDVDTTFTFMGDIYHTDRLGEAVRVPVPGEHFMFDRRIDDGSAFGGHGLIRLAQERPWGQGWSIQAYYDRSEQTGVADFEFRRDTFDVEFRHHFEPVHRHDLIWGMGYRHSRDRTQSNEFIELDPRSRSLDTYSTFIQNTTRIIEDRLFLKLGTKLEHNSFTGVEWQPGGRIWWTPDDRQTLWASVSRPVRVPSRTAEDVRITAAYADTGLLADPQGPPTGTIIPLMILGNPDVRAERLMAYEVGYRIQPIEQLSFDIATFYNDYKDIISIPPPEEGFGQFGNDAEARSWGGEIVIRWRAADNWRLEGAYSHLQLDVQGHVIDDPQRNSPRHMARLSSFLDITDDLEFNAGLYFVDRAPAQQAGSQTRLDLGLTWRPMANFEVAAWGMNLLRRRHTEFSEPLFLAAPVQVERSFYLMGTIRF